MTDLTLRERKQRRAREQIVEAAYALFAERGFADVTVTDIAERAEVGRTTFFRYFGDKQEVLFADEEDLLAAFKSAPSTSAPADLGAALDQLWELASAIGDQLIGDPSRYALHMDLLGANPELGDRLGRKLARVADALEALLLRRGADPEVAVHAGQVAVACFRTAQRVAGPDPAAVMPAMERAVDRLRGR